MGERVVRVLVHMCRGERGWIVAEAPYTLFVPDHDELDPGTLRSLIRKAGLTVEEFTALLD